MDNSPMILRHLWEVPSMGLYTTNENKSHRFPKNYRNQSNFDGVFKLVFFNLKRMPYNMNTPVGFLIAISHEFLMYLYVAMVGTCVITLGIGSYIYGIAMSKCIKGSIFSISRHSHCKKNPSRVFKRIVEFVHYHSRKKMLSKILHCFFLSQNTHSLIMFFQTPNQIDQ